jgi:DNA helicase-2/ATP-dependent DNA helicase PcrA
MPDALLDDLNDAQLAAVTHFRGPLLIIAGAGSGKTRVVTRRIAWLIREGVDPRSILGLTFTNKAAAEMRERVVGMIGASGLRLSTFHSFCARLLRTEHDALGLPQTFTIFDAQDQQAAVKRCVKDLGYEPKYYQPADMLRRISSAKNDGVGPEAFAETNRSYLGQGAAKIYAAYQDFLRRSNALDFDDLLLETRNILDREADIRRHYQQLYRFVLVDEFQDTNLLQAQIADALASTHENICVTGDPDQSIYSWRGATIDNILGFTHRYPEAKVVTLDVNYRSTPTILSAADALIANNTGRIDKTMQTPNADTGKIILRRHGDEEEEAAWVAQTIRDLHLGIAGAETADADGRPIFDEPVAYDQCAVFYRTNAQSRVIEQALRTAAIPYQVVRGVEFYHRAEIRDLVGYLRVLNNPDDDLSLMRVINTPTRGIGSSTISKLADAGSHFEQSLWKVITGPALGKAGLSTGPLRKVRLFVDLMRDLRAVMTGPVHRLLEQLVDAIDYRDYLQSKDPLRAEDKLDNVAELITDAEKFDAGGDAATDQVGLPGYLEHIALVADVDALDEAGETDGQPAGRVPLLTLHAAKGLEFDVVFLIGMEEGVFPHQRVLMGDGDIEEERRLAYVGFTRAKRKLLLAYARMRRQSGSTQWGDPSRFLDEIPTDLIDLPFAMPLTGQAPIAGPDDATRLPRGSAKYKDARLARQLQNVDDILANTHGSHNADGEFEGPPPVRSRLSSVWRRRAAGMSDDLEAADFDGHPDDDELGVHIDERPQTAPRSAPQAELPPGMTTIDLDDPLTLSPGDRVFHESFGLGAVVRVYGRSGNAKGEIDFDQAGRKRVVLTGFVRRVRE